MTAQFQTSHTREEAHKAIGLYAVLARDVMDFIEMTGEASDTVLCVLYEMLATPNNESSERDQRLNESGADLVKGSLEARKVPLPVIALMPARHTAL